MFDPLPLTASLKLRKHHYHHVLAAITAILADEPDWICAMATVACELHAAFDFFHWTGFYRAAAPGELRVGPYQGGHGCLRIDYARGVCGAAARTQSTQRVPDVSAFPGHIACSTSTRSEMVIPILTPQGRLLAVLDVDSDAPAAFEQTDQDALESLCRWLGATYAETSLL